MALLRMIVMITTTAMALINDNDHVTIIIVSLSYIFINKNGNNEQFPRFYDSFGIIHGPSHHQNHDGWWQRPSIGLPT